MAKKKVSAYTAATSYLATDGIPLIAGYGTSPASRIMSMTNLFTKGVTNITTAGKLSGSNFKSNTATGGQNVMAIGENVLALGGTCERSFFAGTDIAYGYAVNSDGTGGDAHIFGCDNTLIGAQIGINMRSPAKRNVGLGSYCLEDLTTGAANIAIGYRSCTDITIGYNNIGIGDGAFMAATDSSNCTCVGIEAGLSAGRTVTIRDATCYGFHAGYGDVTFVLGVGSWSTWIGSQSGGGLRNTTTNANTTAIGAYAGFSGGANCLFVGYCAGRHSTEDNVFYLDGLSRDSEVNEKTKSLMYGTFNTDQSLQTLLINAKTTFGISSHHADGVKANFGTDNDACIYDNGSFFYIDPGAHATYLKGDVYFTGTAVATTVRLSASAGHAYLYVIGYGTSGFYIKSETGNDVYVYNVSAGSIYFGTSNALRMTIAAAGGVSVTGTFSASSVISAPGWLNVNTPGVTSVAPLTVKSTTNGPAIHIRGLAAAGYLQFLKDTGSTDMGYFGYADTGYIFTGGAAGAMCLRSEGDIILGSGGNNIRLTIAAAGTVTVAGALVATGGLSIGAANRPVVAADATVATLISAMTTAGWIKAS